MQYILSTQEEKRGRVLEVWWFGNFGNLTKFDVEDGEICNMDAQTQDESGEIQKTPTT